MQIPEDLKNLLTEERLDLVSALVSPEKKGNLISIANAAEEQIDLFLGGYLASPQHAQDQDAKLPKGAVFNDKIKALERILPKVDLDPATRKVHVGFLQALRKLRNVAAHGYGVSSEEALELARLSILARYFRAQPWNCSVFEGCHPKGLHYTAPRSISLS
jgi:hypothetical protein